MQDNTSVQKFMEDIMPLLVHAVEGLTKEVEKLNVNLELVSRMDSDNLEDSCDCEGCRGMEH
jgi:hypothetical protein